MNLPTSTYHAPVLPDVRTPTDEMGLRRHLDPDAVVYLGATDMNDGRTMLVFEQDGQRRAVAVRGSITQLNHEQTDREVEWSRKRHSHAEACLETIYRPSEKVTPARTPDAAPAIEAAPFVAATVAEDATLQGDSGSGATRREFDMPASRRIIGDDDLPPAPAWLEGASGTVTSHERTIEGWE